MRSILLLIAFTVAAYAQQTIRLPLGGGVEMELVRIEPGKFTQGAGDSAAPAGELQREVNLTRPFYMGKFPVTRGQFARFAAATNYRTESEKGVSGGFGWEGGKLVQKKQYTWRAPGFPQTDDHPVVMVDFADAKAFCAWLSRQAGRPVALPTEAQWEYAARGGGNAGEAWTAANSPAGTQPVGRQKANGFGLHDMLGNAWEWCEDWFAPYSSGSIADPVQTNANLSDKPRRVMRGGAFSRPVADASVARRYRNDPGSRNADNGFRVIASAAAPVAAAVPAIVVPPAPTVNLEQPLPPRPAQPVSRQEIPGALNVPAAPSHSAAEMPERESSRSGGSGFLFWGVLAVGALVVWKVVKRFLGGIKASPVRDVPMPMQAPADVPAGNGGMFTIRIVQDGFWIRSRAPVGTTLQARWIGASSTHSRTLEYRPGPDGLFVFTGGQPSNVSVSVGETSGGGGILDSSGRSMDLGIAGGLLSNPRSTIDDDDRRRNDDVPPPREKRFSGFPSAY